MKSQVILLTGGSSGIGYTTALRLAQQGHIVYAAARRVEKMTDLVAAGVHALCMDVTDEASMQTGVQTILSEQGRIDVLINNAGYGYFGAIENVTMEEARRQLEVNLFGLARLTQLVLPIMRQQGSGRIINTSSIAGRLVLAYGGWYHVSKYAVEAFSDALRIEMKPYGIRVILIEPGAIRTPWGLIAADNLQQSSQGTPYESSAVREATLTRRMYTSNLLSGPETVTRAICRAVNARCPRLRYNPGLGARTLLFFHSVLPARLWDAINRLAVGMNHQ